MPVSVLEWIRQHGVSTGCLYTALAVCALEFSGCVAGLEGLESGPGALQRGPAGDDVIESGASSGTLDGGTFSVSSGVSSEDSRARDGGTGLEPEVTIEAISFFGPCRANAVLAPDGKNARLVFDVKMASDPGVVRTFCKANVFIRVPPGYAFALEGISGVGEVDLPKGASAVFHTEYAPRTFKGASKPVVANFAGPLEGPVTFEHHFPDYGFSCGSDPLELTFLFALDNRTDLPASVTLHSLELGRFSVEPCPPN